VARTWLDHQVTRCGPSFVDGDWFGLVITPSRPQWQIRKDKIRLVGFTNDTTRMLRDAAMLGPSHPTLSYLLSL
jgi:hypothetical protein